MALTAVEQLQLRDTGIASLTYPMEDVIHQVALNSALNFQRNEKAVDEMTQPLAGSYVQKMRGTIGLVYKGEPDTIRGLEWLMVSALALTTYTYVQIAGATEEGALGFFNDEIFEILENISLINNDEKAAYDAL